MLKYTRILILLLLALVPLTSIAQLTKSELKVYKKTEKLYGKKKYSEAIDKFEPILFAHPDECNVWGVMLKYQQSKYTSTKNMFSGISFTVSDNDSSSEDSKQAMKELADMLVNMPKYQFLGALKTSTLRCQTDRIAQIILRSMTIDQLYNPDTAISNVAKDHTATAEEYFANGDYENAIKYFKKALAKEPDYYQAIVHLGDSYYAQKKYDKAAEYFKTAAEKWPNLLEAHKYLVDAYLENGDDEEAMEACIKGILCYPSDDMFQRYAKASKESSGKFDSKWMVRGAKVASYKHQWFYIDLPVEGAWEVYDKAKSDIKAYCDTTTGIVTTENDVTKAAYLEVYAWEKMLKNTESSEFDFAKKMQEKGYLDCYVLISLFQIDLYDQQQDFVTKNPDKVKEYLKVLAAESR